MLALAIDTSINICTLALGDGTDILAEYHFYHNMDLLQRIMQVVDMILTDTGKSVKDIDIIIVSLGPGSFTGLRIGITVGKMLAYTLNKPIVGVGTLDAIAAGAAPSAAEIICPLVHSRKNEVYFSIFTKDNEKLADYSAVSVDELPQKLEAYKNILFCGNGAEKNKEKLISLFPQCTIAPNWLSFARGAALLALGMKKAASGEFTDAAVLAPLYIKKPTPVVKLEEKENKNIIK